MLIADAQVHIWALNTPERPWRPSQNVHREIPLGADEVFTEHTTWLSADDLEWIMGHGLCEWLGWR